MWRKTPKIPKEAYQQALWLIRYYPQLSEEAEAILVASSKQDGQPRGTDTSDPTANLALKRERYITKMRYVENGLRIVPEEYRSSIWRSVVYREPTQIYANHKTLQHWRSEFIKEVARLAGIV